MVDGKNLTMLTDFYEFTMAGGFWNSPQRDTIGYYDMYFRTVPENGGYVIACGLESVVEYLSNLHFSDEDIEYLRNKKIFAEDFLEYLRNFQFQCDVWAVPEGTPMFPNEPLVTVRGPVIQAQLLETMILICMNHQTLIATKASRVVRAAAGRPVMEFGARRAQGYAAAILGARATYIAGCSSTSCTISDRQYNIPVSGTMAHSWVQLFPSEYEAFASYAKSYPDSCVLLIDTYNVLKSGLPNAIKCFKEVLAPMGYRPKGIRIDSGDVTYLTKKIRKVLDDEGFSDCKIVVSNSLDENIISTLIAQGAEIDSFGVGERLITSRAEPVLGGVYKLTAIEDEKGNIIPKIKLSENVAKITTPCFKQIYRLYSKESDQAFADIVALHHETIDDSRDITIFDPEFTWKKKTVSNFYAKPLMVQIFKDGKLVYDLPDVEDIRSYCSAQMDTIWDEVKRFDNPHKYYVDLSKKLWNIKQELLDKYSE
ncbi:MAG: nicotinate phosphoribosyltransferase [Clostridia bacterium]|nr:nicotinate phosphoribosyltransferase [Clostridia bacterium]